MWKFYPLVIILIYQFITETMLFTDYTFEYANFLNESSRVPGYGNMSLKRVSHNYPKIFANIVITDSFRHYDAEFKMFYSPLGNRRYILLPFKIYRQPACSLLNNEYRTRFMHDLRNYSNLPFSEDRNVDLCDLIPPGLYYCRNYSADLSTIPRSFATGRYRVQFLLYKKRERTPCQGMEFSSLFT